MEHRVRDYQAEERAVCISTESTSTHPLAAVEGSVEVASTKTVVKLSNQPPEATASAEEFNDPLGILGRGSGAAQSIQEEDGPGTSYSSLPVSKGRRGRHAGQFFPEEQAAKAAEEWNSKKVLIMQRFASSGTISVSKTFDIVSRDRGRAKSFSMSRLEELEDPAKEAREEVKLISQQEYITRLRELNHEIAQAWASSERVVALRLAVKVARLLADTSVPQFYPTLFVLVTDVMDTVGNLVWNRIKSKAELDDSGKRIRTLDAGFTASDVCQVAKETCSNWFYKIGSVRDLLPRVYLEMALLRCMHFLSDQPPLPSFQRLTAMLRGVSNPIAGAYARLYLTCKAQAILPPHAAIRAGVIGIPGMPLQEDPRESYSSLLGQLGLPVPSSLPSRPQGFLMTALSDFLLVFRRVLAGDFDKRLRNDGMEKRQYLQLLQPPIECMVHGIASSASQEVLEELVSTFGGVRQDTPPPISVVVHEVLKQLPPPYIANNPVAMADMIIGANDMSLSQSQNFRLLGAKLGECSPPRDFRLPLLNTVWKVVSRYTVLTEFLSVADTFVEYILKNFSVIEVNVLLKDVHKHLGRNKVTETELSILESIVFRLVTHYQSLTDFLSLSHIVDILDCFYGDLQTAMYLRILGAAARSDGQMSDPVVSNFLFEISRTLHNEMDGTRSEEEVGRAGRLVARFVQQVHFEKDLNLHLNFLVDCRSTFTSFEAVLETVVHAACRLSVTSLCLNGGNHSSLSLEFARGAAAFRETTIPSIPSLLSRLHLYLLSAEVALMDGLVLHAVGLIKAAIVALQDAQQGTDAVGQAELATLEGEEQMVHFLRKLAGFLVVLPGDPEKGPLFLVNALLTVLETHQWKSTTTKLQTYCGLLLLTGALAQDRLPYRASSELVESSDELFCGDTDRKAELAAVAGNHLAQLILSALEVAPESAAMGRLALDVANMFMLTFKMNAPSRKLVSKVMQKAVPLLQTSDEYLRETIEYATVLRG